MTEIDDLIATFRDTIEPDPGMARRVATQARQRATGRAAGSTRIWRRPRVLVPTLGGVVAVAGASAAVLMLTGGGPSLVERVAAAVSPPGEVLHLASRITQNQTEVRPDGRRVVGADQVSRMEDWSLVAADGTVRMRRLISDAPPGEAPTDEDTVVVVAGDGEPWLATWTPTSGGGRPGTLAIGLNPDTKVFANTWSTLLADAYRDGRLREAGHTPEGLLRLTGKGLTSAPGTEDDCARTQVTLNPRSFLPVRLTEESGCIQAGTTTYRQRIVADFQAVERDAADASSLANLQMGRWPIGRAVRVAPVGTADGVQQRPLPIADALAELRRMGVWR